VSATEPAVTPPAPRESFWQRYGTKIFWSVVGVGCLVAYLGWGRSDKPAQTPYERYAAATVRAGLPGAWPESAVQTISTAACNPDQTSMEKVLVAAQLEKTPVDFGTELVEVYFVARYYCSDKDQHLNVFNVIARDWPNNAVVVSAMADKADGVS
jgi:hypothetical protein